MLTARDKERIGHAINDILNLPDDGKITITLPPKPRSRKPPPTVPFYSTIPDLKFAIKAIENEKAEAITKAREAESESAKDRYNKNFISRRHKVATEAMMTLQESLDGLPLAYLNQMIEKMEAIHDGSSTN